MLPGCQQDSTAFSAKACPLPLLARQPGPARGLANPVQPGASRPCRCPSPRQAHTQAGGFSSPASRIHLGEICATTTSGDTPVSDGVTPGNKAEHLAAARPSPQVPILGAGRVKGVVCPFFFRFRAGLRACRMGGRGQGGAPCWTNDLDAGRPFGTRWRGLETVSACGGSAPRAQFVSWGRLAAAFIPSGVPAAGCRGGMGRVRVRAAGSIRQAASPPGAGAGKPAITRCSRPGLLTRPAALRWPGIGPGRRAWRRRPR